MTVFIAHAPKDAPAAEALEKYLERRGLFVERETGERGFRFAQPRDAIVVLWSRDTVFTPYRLQIEKRALDAWADEQLIFVKLDHHVAPVGLRDLTAIDAAFEPQREIAWAAVAKAAQDLQLGRRERAAPPAPPLTPPPAAEPQPLPRRAPVSESGDDGGWLYAIGALIAIPAGAVLSLAVGLRDPAWPIVFSGALAGLVWWLARSANQGGTPKGAAGDETGRDSVDDSRLRRKTSSVPTQAPGAAAPPPAPAAPPAGATFVSYAHADSAAVLPVVDAVAAQGASIWIDRAGIQAGEGWAGEIVRAIKSAGGVVIMCSAKAFESDHVRREVYLADRYKKPMLPVFLDASAPPEDFEYFFAGVQWLKLFEAAEPDRAAMLAKALPKA